MHELGFLLSPAIQDITATAVAVAIAIVSAGEFGLARIVAGDAVFYFLEDADTEGIDHGDIVNYNRNKGFADGPRTSLLGTVDGVLVRVN